jgi:peptidyl-prolyl cis-trans isomerase SurA
MLEEQKDDLRSEVVANLCMERYLQSVIGNIPAPIEDELRNYYQSRKKEYRSPIEAHCLHLIKLIDGHHDHRELLEEMVALRERFVAGEDFSTLAAEETEKTSKEVDLGWIPLDRPTNPFETILFSMHEGEISPVISYEHALHIVKVDGRRGGESPDFADVQAELAQRLHQENRQAALREVAKKLRAKAKIEQVEFGSDD